MIERHKQDMLGSRSGLSSHGGGGGGGPSSSQQSLVDTELSQLDMRNNASPPAQYR